MEFAQKLRECRSPAAMGTDGGQPSASLTRGARPAIVPVVFSTRVESQSVGLCDATGSASEYLLYSHNGGCSLHSACAVGVMYVADPPPSGEPVDPIGFLGLRYRIAYTSHDAQAARSLGTLDASHRAHLLYWADASNDLTGKEAQWQRSRWSVLAQTQDFVPQSAKNAKAELLRVLRNPQPAPTSYALLFLPVQRRCRK